jgi:serine/threonine protein kinase
MNLVNNGRRTDTAGSSTPDPDDPRVIAALEEYAAALNAGRAPDRETFQMRHPDIAATLADCLDGLEWMRGAPQGGLTPHGGLTPRRSPESPAPGAGTALGDFRILREIGRGGMGLVYEAEQVSLGRKVALKVLPFAAALDVRQLQRFKNEAQAAAGLHHPNIVPVHGVGCERGVHFYAMQYIDGQSLAALIGELRRPAERDTADPTQAPRARALADDLTSGRWVPPGRPAGDEPTGPYTPSSLPQSTPPDAGAQTVALSAECTARSTAYFRTVAGLGVQAALALEHAHGLGVIHRDIKPGNLLLDGHGRLWVTDFGLAHCRSQPGLTATGDLVGTLRYMSPEQALAQRAAVDQRTDIYSLGATLYELLTLESAFNGRDREELLRQIAFEEPRPPRRLNKAVPPELETIVLKAMEKNPPDRYGTAQDLADDLRRFLDDEPIRARRPTPVQRVRKWVRRHEGVAATLTVALFVAALILAVSTWLITKNLKRAEQAREDEHAQRERADRARVQAQEAEAQARRAEAKAEALNQFLVRNMLTFSPPGRFGYRAGDATVAQVLEEASRSVDTAFPGQPELEASVRLTIGNTYFRLGMFREAEPQLRRGLHLRGNLLADSADPWGRDYAETAFATTTLGLALQALGRNEEAKPFLLRGGEARRRIEVRRIPFRVNAWPFSLHPLAVALSPDARWLLVMGDDDCLRLCDVATGVEVHRFPAHSALSLAFSPDGRHALTGHLDHTMRVWDVYTAREVRQLAAHTDEVRVVAFSPDGRQALSAGRDRTMRLWDMRSGKEIRRFLGHTDGVHYAVFSPDGRRVLSASGDGTIRLWEPATGREIRCFGKRWAYVGLAVFSPDGRRALSNHEDGLRLWDAETGEELRRIPDPAGVGDPAFTPDGHHAVSSGDTKGKWFLWDLDTGKEVRSYHVEPPLVPKRIEVTADGRLAVCGNWRGSISIWRLGDPPPLGQELPEARRNYERQRRDLDPAHPETLRALDELAALHLDRGEPADAEPLFRQSLESKRRALGKEHPATLASMKNLAQVLQAQSKVSEAVALRRQCLDIYRRVQGPANPDVFVAMNDLADALDAQGKRDEANVLCRHCLEGWYRLRGGEHPETHAARRKLALRLQAHGGSVGPEPSGPALGSVYAEMGQWDKALAGYARAFETGWPKHPYLWLEYACLLVRQGDTAGYRKLCAGLVRSFGQSKDGHEIDLLAHVCVVGSKALADTNRVMELARQRMAGARRYGPPYGWSLHVLALACYRSGRYQEAIDVMSPALTPRPEGLWTVMHWLLTAMIQQRLGHAEEARRWFDKADRWIKAQTPRTAQPEDLSFLPPPPWRDWLMVRLLHREAAVLIRGRVTE